MVRSNGGPSSWRRIRVTVKKPDARLAHNRGLARRLMELRWIEAFVAVAEELHFGRAAERLRMAQSPLSQTIKKLERDLGVELFDRNTRAVDLTDAGWSFLPHARAVLAEIDLGRRASHSSKDSVYGNVVIGFSGALNHKTLPPLTRAVRERYPNIDLSFVGSILTQEGLSELRRGNLDMVFIGLPVDAQGLSTLLISREPLGVVVPNDHRLATEESVILGELAEEAFVMLPARQGSSLRENIIAACLEAGFRPRVAQEVVDAYTALSMVAGGVGVSLMPASIADIMPKGITFVPIAGGEHMLDSGIAWNPNNSSAALQAVVQTAEAVLLP